MALTDALSVACKALGIAADVYWDKDKTKYDKTDIVAKSMSLHARNAGRSWKRAGLQRRHGVDHEARERQHGKFRRLLPGLH